MPAVLAAYYAGQTRFQLGNNTNLFDFTEVSNVAHAHHLAAAALLGTLDREEQGQSAPLAHERVDGEAFLITNDQTCFFWDFQRMIWRAAGDETTSRQVWKIPKDFGLLLASLFEWIFWIMGWGVPKLTRSKIKYSCMTRYFSVEKAKRRLGYRPVVSLEEGVRRGVAHCIRVGNVVGMPESVKGNVPEHLREAKKDR